MNMQSCRDFVKDLFTLRTVWIDKGSGRWAVKKRLHPLLRSICWVIALVVSAGVYSSLTNNHHSKAIAQPEVTAKLPEPVKTLPDPEPLPEQTSIMIPLNNTARRAKIIFPSEIDSDTDTIIKKPIEIMRTEPVKKSSSFEGFNVNDEKYRIFVHKASYTLSLFRGSELVKEYPIAIGKNPGDKQRVGDNRTPVGNFKIVSIENASSWKHDFRDGKGKIAGAYGPWFLRLDAKGWKGIGIHGTHDPDSRGTNATEGCIRLSNEDISELRQYAYQNMPVVIRED